MSPGHRASPPRHQQALVTWLAIYPTITLALWLFQQFGLLALPLALRTLVLTAVLVPVMVYVLIPALTVALRALAARAHDARSSASGRPPTASTRRCTHPRLPRQET